MPKSVATDRSQPSVDANAIHANASVVRARAANASTPSTASLPPTSEATFRNTSVEDCSGFNGSKGTGQNEIGNQFSELIPDLVFTPDPGPRTLDSGPWTLDYFTAAGTVRSIPAFFSVAASVVAFAITARAQRLIDAEASRFRDEVAALDAAGRIDRAASAAAIRESGLPALADALENTAATGPVVAAKLAAAGIAVTGDGTRLAARWPTVGWQLLAYVVITAAEVLVSITCLEFSYTQAPPHMKSLIMSLYLLSISMGNLFTALVNTVTKDAAGNSTLTGERYYWFFTGCMAVATVLLLPVLASYKPREYLQGGPVGPAD